MKRKLFAIGFCIVYLFVLLTFAAVTRINLATQIHGVLPVANGGTGVSVASKNTLFSGPLVGSAAAPSFKSSHLLLPNIPLPMSRKSYYHPSGATTTYGANGMFQLCGGAGGISAPTATDPIYQSATSGTTSGNTATFPNSCAPIARFDSSPYMEIMAAMSSTTNNRQWIILGNAILGNVDDGLFDGLAFRYSTNASDTHWQCVTNGNSATSNFVDSGITPDTHFHKFAAYYDSGSSTAYFWIDNVSVCGAVTTKVPRSNQIAQLAQTCTTLLTGQSCAAKAAWAYMEGDK